ncbi:MULTISPECIES: DUF5518 domain-containing protein [Salinibaculum]|uniref:DUF5518 domain-containing protein n=1 Tax=Salinibaculum TaxID=2732368 RepID=UPI0030D4794D
MVETKWRAVAIGFVIIALLSIISTSFQQLALVGGVVAGLAGGFAAGYYARSGQTNGAWNGFLAGSIGALVFAAVLVLLGLAVSIVELSLGGVFATIGVGIAFLVFIVIGAIPATVGGYLGGMYPREESEEVGRPAA